MSRRLLIAWAVLVGLWLVATAASDSCAESAGSCASGVLTVLIVGAGGAAVILVGAWLARR